MPDDSAERGRGVSAGSKGLIAVLVFGALILLRLSIRHGFPIWIAIPLGVTMLVSMVAGLTWSVIGIVRKRGELSGTLGLLLGLGLFAWLCFLMK